MLSQAKSFLFENKTTKQTVAKNAFWLFFGNITSRLIKAGIIIYAARILGASEWGAFSYALSLAAFFTVFTDFGISAVITRESARDITVQEKYFSTSIVIKAVMTLVVILLIILAAPLIVKQPEVLALLPIVIILVSFDGLRDFGASLSRAWEKMEVEAAIQILTNVAIVVAGVIALTMHPSAYSLSVGYTIGVTIGMFGAFWPFRHYFKNIAQKFDKNLVKSILYASWPIGMLGLMGAIMLNTDTMMIGWFRSLEDVGYYSAGQRIILLIYIIPGLVTTALFPSLLKVTSQEERFQNILQRVLIFLCLLALPMTAGSILLSKEIIYLIYGENFLYGAGAYALMSITYVPTFIASILGTMIFIFNKEKQLIAYVLLGISGNFLFNLFLIPAFGIIGAAISTIINQIIITIYLFYKVNNHVKLSLFSKLKKGLVATFIMVIAVYIMQLINMHLLVIIPFAAIIYGLILFTLKDAIFLEAITPALNRLKKSPAL